MTVNKRLSLCSFTILARLIICNHVLEPEWSGEALRIMAGLTAGQLLHAQVAGYDEAGLPLVHLYLTLHPQVFIKVV